MFDDGLPAVPDELLGRGRVGSAKWAVRLHLALCVAVVAVVWFVPL